MLLFGNSLLQIIDKIEKNWDWRAFDGFCREIPIKFLTKNLLAIYTRICAEVSVAIKSNSLVLLYDRYTRVL